MMFPQNNSLERAVGRYAASALLLAVSIGLGLAPSLARGEGDEAQRTSKSIKQEHRYVPAPPDNPLKGLVPYARPTEGRFPCSMEFSYLPLSDLLVGYAAGVTPAQGVHGGSSSFVYNWKPLEDLLNDISSRRRQAVFRIWMEYPGREEGIPKFLEDGGLKVTEWLNTNTDPFPHQKVRTPNYEDFHLRAALRSFIAALGQKYDGDPRIGYITAGLLGTWGEWHTYPKSELMASKPVQAEVMDAYERSFSRTPVLLRYPAAEKSYAHASNHTRQLGYHDDSFAWATLETGRAEDHWYFLAAMREAGPKAMNKWKSFPIGGEIRPELWGQIFDAKPAHQHAQDFAECVRQTHVTWLMDSGMFSERQSPERIANAIHHVQRMGYEFHIVSSQIERVANQDWQINIEIRNTGIAPFYHDWKVELGLMDNGALKEQIPVNWTVKGLQPGDPPRQWSCKVPASKVKGSSPRFALRIANPLPNGLPLRFANEYADDISDGWWTVGR